MEDSYYTKFSRLIGNRGIRITGLIGLGLALDQTSKHFGIEIEKEHILGGLAGLTCKIVDQISTIPLIRQFNSPECIKNGVQENFWETNIATGKHPTMKQYLQRSIPADILFVTVSTMLPLLGYTFMLASPLIYRNNHSLSKLIEAEYTSNPVR